jgi:hypothetical protein
MPNVWLNYTLDWLNTEMKLPGFNEEIANMNEETGQLLKSRI